MSQFSRSARRRSPFSIELQPLESRRLFCADFGNHLDGDAFGTFPTLTAGSALAETAAPALSAVGVGVSLDQLPALSSRPGATAKVYLDFNGDVTPTWVNDAPGVTPAYDQDGDAATFSAGEVASIRDIW